MNHTTQHNCPWFHKSMQPLPEHFAHGREVLFESGDNYNPKIQRGDPSQKNKNSELRLRSIFVVACRITAPCPCNGIKHFLKFALREAKSRKKSKSFRPWTILRQYERTMCLTGRMHAFQNSVRYCSPSALYSTTFFHLIFRSYDGDQELRWIPLSIPSWNEERDIFLHGPSYGDTL